MLKAKPSQSESASRLDFCMTCARADWAPEASTVDRAFHRRFAVERWVLFLSQTSEANNAGSFPPFNSPPPRTARYALARVISGRGHHEIHDGIVYGDDHHLVDDAPSRLPPPQPSLVDMAVTVDQYLCTGRATPKGDPWVRLPGVTRNGDRPTSSWFCPNGPEKGRL